MHARRLILFPIVALLAVVLVGAIIDSGQRARMARDAAADPRPNPTEPALAAEADRIRQALAAELRCANEVSCGAEATSARLRQTAHDIDSWTAERRFQRVRSSLQRQLLARADVLDQEAAIAVQGRPTPSDRAKLSALRDRYDDARLAAVRAQRSARLIDRATFDALVAKLS